MKYSYDNIDPNDLLIKIQSDKSISNLGITQCIDVFSSPEEIKSNGGFYTLLIILIIFIIIFIIYYIKGKNLLENKIDEVIYNQFEKNEKKKEKNIKKENNKVIDNIIGSKINNKKIRKKRKQKKGKKILNKEKNIKNEKHW
jgi:amino acid permease